MVCLNVSNISRCYFLNKKKLEEIVRFILRSVGVFQANLSIVFVTDRQIKRLNYLYRKKNRATDVLAFSMRGGKPPFAVAEPSLAKRASGGGRLRNELSILGDIAISVDRAKKQAKRFDSTFKKEIYLYIIHGILHLVGYGDEKPSAKRLMRRKEMEILNALCQRVN